MYIYTKKGFIVGIPARNLSDDEARAFGIDKVTKGGIYVHAQDGTSDAGYKPVKKIKTFKKRPSDDGGLG